MNMHIFHKYELVKAEAYNDTSFSKKGTPMTHCFYKCKECNKTKDEFINGWWELEDGQLRIITFKST